MKKILLLTALLTCFSLSAYGLEPKYTVHTSAKDIEYKKKKALQWYSSNVENKKAYENDPVKQISSLRSKALTWYENNITKGKFYFVHSDKELAFTKKKALRWHERNSN